MVKELVVLCIVAAVQACSSYEVAVPVFRQPYGAEGIGTRIFGGQRASRGQFPHQAGINVDVHAFCGGSLISKNWILTAGHCIGPFRQWEIILGANYFRDNTEPGRVVLLSNHAITHEDYDPTIANNDVGVIRLPEDVPLNNLINIIALPPRSWKDQDLTGNQVRVSGWGKTTDDVNTIFKTWLKFVDLALISNEECSTVYGGIITNTKYCCSADDQKSTCQGDSGGALTVGSGQNLTNLGIVSFGSKQGCTKGYPVGFTATPHYVDWISSKTGIPVRDF